MRDVHSWGESVSRCAPVSISDEEILTGIHERADLFGLFFDRHYDDVLRFFVGRVRDLDAAADLCAETLAAALAGAGTFDPAAGSARQWLFGIARYKLFGYWRARRADTSTLQRLGIACVPLDDGQAEIARVEARADRQGLLDALACLPEDQRDAVWLRVVDERTYDDIAAELSCRAATARVKVHRGLRRLRALLDRGDAP